MLLIVTKIVKAAHNLCNSTRWQKMRQTCPGMIERVIDSNYAFGEPVAFNPLDGNFLQSRFAAFHIRV